MQRKRAKYERLSEIKQNNCRVQYTLYKEMPVETALGSNQIHAGSWQAKVNFKSCASPCNQKKSNPGHNLFGK
jgi:hypothetical protein